MERIFVFSKRFILLRNLIKDKKYVREKMIMVSMILESVNHEYNFNFSSFVLTFSIEINFLVKSEK